MNEKLDELLKVQGKLEKEVLKVFRDHSIVQSFGEFENSLAHKRNTEYYDLKQRISKIRSSTVHFKRELQANDQQAKPTFVENVKQSLEGIEQSILSFKEDQRKLYEQLLLEEATAFQEVLAHDRRIEAWLTNRPNRKPPLIVTVQQQSLNDKELSVAGLPPAIAIFEKFLSQTGGHTGGWEELDHLTFVRLWKKHQGGTSSSFFDIIAAEIPTHSSDEILKHNKWYIEYCKLMEDKKRAITEWKKQKQDATMLLANEREIQASKDEEEIQLKIAAKDKVLQKEKEERFSQLKDWKSEKMQQQEKEKKKMEELMKERLRKRKQKEIAHKMIVKAKLNEYSKKKEEEKQKILAKQELKMKEDKERAMLANKEIHKFQERDAITWREKQDRAQLLEHEQIEAEKRLEKLKQTVSVNVSRDPDRLFELTAGWKERKKDDNEYKHDHTGSVLQLSRRAVPQWRRGL